MYVMGRKEIDAVAKIINSGKLFRYEPGGQTDRFEKEWARKMGVRYCLANTSGTISLVCGLAGVGIGPGDEVIVPGYTYIATALAVLAVGAVPILAEIDESLTLDPDDFEKKITSRTKAVIPVHMQGLPCAMDRVLQIAKKHGLKVIEDACQADGGSFRGQRLGSMGHAGANSFNYYKIISAGEGGALLTSDDKVFERALIYHDGGTGFFRTRKMHVPVFAGSNFRTNEIACAILRVQMRRLDGILSALRKEKNRIVAELKDVPGVRFNRVNDAAGDCASTIAFLFDTRKSAAVFVKKMSAAGIPGVHSPIDTDKHVYSNWDAVLEQRGDASEKRNPFRFTERKLTYSKDMLPRTLEVLGRTVYVPTHVKHARKDQDRIIRSVRKSLR
jgi:dTDP-4-amino-4,6-dideoxygalactose transaminase